VLAVVGFLVYLLAGGASSASGPTGCAAGAPALPLVPGAPARFRESPRPALVMGCLRDRAFGTAVLVGYTKKGEFTCAEVYNLRLRRSHGAHCAGRWDDWTRECYGHYACIDHFVHERGFTEFEGPVDPQVKTFEVRVVGKVVHSDVDVAQLDKETALQLRRKVPFGYFSVVLRGCVEPDAVKIKLFNANGPLRGDGGEWQLPLPCPKANSGAQSLGQA
jgi:hypothetical protein